MVLTGRHSATDKWPVVGIRSGRQEIQLAIRCQHPIYADRISIYGPASNEDRGSLLLFGRGELTFGKSVRISSCYGHMCHSEHTG